MKTIASLLLVLVAGFIVFWLFSFPPKVAEQPGSDVWIGTINAPGFWSELEISDLPIQTDRHPKVSLGYSQAKTAVQLMDYSYRDNDLRFEFELTGGLMKLTGQLEGDLLSGQFSASRRDRQLTQSIWSARRFQESSLKPFEIINNARQALGIDGSTLSETGFILQQADSIDANSFSQTTRYGKDLSYEIYQGDRPVRGFDGHMLWMTQGPIGAVIPDRRQEEKQLMRDWVLGYTWIEMADAFDIRAYETVLDQNRVFALVYLRKDGLVPMKLFIDPETWLPIRAETDWDRGPYVMTFSDFQSYQGLLLPRRTESSYTGVPTELFILDVIPLDVESVGRRPELAQIIEFDEALSPHVVSKRDGADGHLFVKAAINGEVLEWFHFDTGAPFMMVDDSLADQLGLPVLAEVGIGKIRLVESFQLGPITLHDQVFISRDLSEMSAPAGAVRAGVVGTPVLQHSVVEYAYFEDRISIYDVANYQLRKGKWMKLETRWVPVVQAEFAGQNTPSFTRAFYLDTGKQGTVSFFSGVSHETGILNGIALTESENLTVSGLTLELEGELRSFTIAGYQIDKPSVRFKIPGTPNDNNDGTAGYIGRGIFGDMTVVFDYTHERIAFLR